MATNYVATPITRAGHLMVYNAAALGDSVTPGENVMLAVKNTGSSTTLTIATVAEEGGLAVEPLVVTIGVGETLVGPIDAELFANLTDGFAHFTWGTVTGITWAAFALAD